MGLIKTEKRGVQKIIYSDKTPEEMFETAKQSMCNPIKRTIFVPKKIFSERIASEEVDLKQLGIRGKTKDSIVSHDLLQDINDILEEYHVPIDPMCGVINNNALPYYGRTVIMIRNARKTGMVKSGDYISGDICYTLSIRCLAEK